MPAPKNKLKSFGKNRREARPMVTTYDAEGNWIGNTQHQDTMRQHANPLFERYYKDLQQLGAVAVKTSSADSDATAEASAARWEAEMEKFRTPLHTTLWINDTDPLACEVQSYFASLGPELVEPIPWYPLPGMAWRVLADKTTFRKRPEMRELRQYLIRQTALGTISRQEEVSMIPPFLLDIQPNDVCLDMCASPGSKTAQMLVALGRHKVVPPDSTTSPFPFDYESDGLVMANELDTKRANMLVHQIRLQTGEDASSASLLSTSPSAAEGPVLRFDKILCDVVCSGDGTLRKAPHIFKIWSPKEAIGLQKTQIYIALRACHLLNVGGRLVYSTCSLNPVENEAVVAQIVHRTRGAMRLVDARGLLPNLPSAPGMQTWTVTDAKGVVYEAPAGNMHEALFPPRTPGGYTSPAVDALDLSLCMRFFPSHCNGGGFFIAVFDKVEEFQLKKKEELELSGEASESLASSAPAKKERKEEPAASAETAVVKKEKILPPRFAPAPEEIRSAISDFYGIKSGFPLDQLFVRMATNATDLRLTPGSVCSILGRTAARVLRCKTPELTIVSAGLRVIAYETLDKGWRIASESALLFAKLMKGSPRCVRVPVALVQDMIQHGGKLKEKLLDDLEDDVLRAQLEALPVGTILLEVVAPKALGGVQYSVALRARSRIQLLVDHEELEGMQLRMGEEPVVPVAAPPAVAAETPAAVHGEEVQENE